VGSVWRQNLTEKWRPFSTQSTTFGNIPGRYFIGNPFAGYFVGICFKDNPTPEVWFGSQLLGSLDIEGGLINYSSALRLSKVS
jgi:hypothetical protein